MKLYNISIYTLTLTGMIALAGCEKDTDTVANQCEGEKIAVTAQTDGDNSTRTTLNGFHTEWVAGDRIGVFSSQAGASNALNTAASSAAVSVFEGEMKWGSGAHNFYAYYPYASGEVDYSAVPVSLPALQTQSAGDNSDHIGALDFMVAAPITGLQPGSDVGFSFGHPFTLLEFRVLGEGLLSNIELVTQASNTLAFSGGTIDISQPKPAAGSVYAINYSGPKSASVALELSSVATLTGDEATTPALRMMVNPVDLSGQQIELRATVDGETTSISADGFRMARGLKYTLVVDLDAGTTGPIEEDVLAMIPDPVFRDWCAEQMDIWDTNRNGKLSFAEAAAVTAIDCGNEWNWEGDKIVSLEGIEYFTGLTRLYCYNNVIKSADLSNNVALAYLDLTSNRLTSLDISECTELFFLNIIDNQIESLDISNNRALTNLICTQNHLSSLDTSNNTALTDLSCTWNWLRSLDISKNTALTTLICWDNPGNGEIFPIKAWFDDDSVPQGWSTEPWQYPAWSGIYVTPVFYTGDAPPGYIEPEVPMSLLDSDIDPRSTVVKYTVSDEQYGQLLDWNGFYGVIQSVTSKVYSKLDDDFDFVFHVLDMPESRDIIDGLGFYAVNMGVSNAVEGIGLNTYSDAGMWGSSGRLKSVMYFPFASAISRGPTLHEIAHNWAAFIQPYRYNPDDTVENGGHWSVSNAGGQLGGFRYIRTVEENSGGIPGNTLYQASFYPDKNPDGSFVSGFGDVANGGNGPAYSDIELYLMGMKSAGELRDTGFTLDIYSGNNWERDPFQQGYFWSTTKTSYTIDDIISLNGPRVPDAASSQKSFKVLTVVLTPEGQTEHHYDEIINDLLWIAGSENDNPDGGIKNFRQATYGRGTLVVDGVKNSLKTSSRSMSVRPAVISSPVSAGSDHRSRMHIDKVNEQLIAPRR